ncbi:LysR family transcriptional regulator [Methylobacterium nigriterrae]|uniref:LysR family transcriptional regulator n=1 Tax=Methylobacterium nigriterrae TaxID=3127512 RepID=UPI003013B838
MQELLEPGGLEELAAFVAVAEAGSFAEASKKLGRDASVVSRRVSQLEQRLGVRLLSRTTRRVALTEVGAIYCRRVQALLDELASASQEASDFAASPQGLVRVSVPVTFGRQWIAPLLPSFLARHPQIRIDARFTDRFVDVVAEGFDVAIRVGARGLRDSSLTARRLASYRNLLVAAPSYLAAHGTPQAPTDLVDHACLGFTGHAAWPDWPLMKDGTRRTVRPACSLIADHSEVPLMAAIDGAGITLTAHWLAGPAIRAGQLIEVLPGWGGKEEGGVYAILPPGRLVPTKTRVFVEEVTQAIKAGWSQ